mmetsp:Transcript_65425/g.182043  ORF Transcript_65425/g.182043 Transcript_65425/m.182043 type:complete len:548 (+) Transcript_65425:708-2351(+)
MAGPKTMARSSRQVATYSSISVSFRKPGCRNRWAVRSSASLLMALRRTAWKFVGLRRCCSALSGSSKTKETTATSAQMRPSAPSTESESKSANLSSMPMRSVTASSTAATMWTPRGNESKKRQSSSNVSTRSAAARASPRMASSIAFQRARTAESARRRPGCSTRATYLPRAGLVAKHSARSCDFSKMSPTSVASSAASGPPSASPRAPPPTASAACPASLRGLQAPPPLVAAVSRSHTNSASAAVQTSRNPAPRPGCSLLSGGLSASWATESANCSMPANKPPTASPTPLPTSCPTTLVSPLRRFDSPAITRPRIEPSPPLGATSRSSRPSASAAAQGKGRLESKSANAAAAAPAPPTAAILPWKRTKCWIVCSKMAFEAGSESSGMRALTKSRASLASATAKLVGRSAVRNALACCACRPWAAMSSAPRSHLSSSEMCSAAKSVKNLNAHSGLSMRQSSLSGRQKWYLKRATSGADIASPAQEALESPETSSDWLVPPTDGSGRPIPVPTACWMRFSSARCARKSSAHSHRARATGTIGTTSPDG